MTDTIFPYFGYMTINIVMIIIIVDQNKISHWPSIFVEIPLWNESIKLDLDCF